MRLRAAGAGRAHLDLTRGFPRWSPSALKRPPITAEALCMPTMHDSAGAIPASTATPTLDNASILRLLKDLIRAELRARSGVSVPDDQAAAWNGTTTFGTPELETDSLELVAIAGRVNQFFQLHDSGIEDYLLRDRSLGDWVKIVQHSRAIADAGFTFNTSGSTGTPKSVSLPTESLRQEVAAIESLLCAHSGLAAPRPISRVVALVPPQHVFGFLFTVLLPLKLGAEVIDARSMAPAPLHAAMTPETLVVGVPASFEYLARSLRCLGGARCAVSTGTLDGPTVESLRSIGAGEILEFYGSTETAGIGWRALGSPRTSLDRTTHGPDRADQPFTLHEFWSRWVAPGGSAGDTPTTTHGPAPVDAHATWLIRTTPSGAAAAPVLLMDRLDWLDDRRFTLRGRLDHAVKIGGVNVFPARVERVLASHAAVAAVRVRLMRPDEGERLKAFVVPHVGATRGHDWESALTRELIDLCRLELSAQERPKAFAFGAELPTNSIGKPADW